MLGDEEAAAVVLGLLAAQRFGVATADGALTKIRRVLPEALRLRVRYAPHEGEPGPRDMTPWGLVLHAGRW